MIQVPEADVDVSSCRLSHTLTLSADGLAKREKCIAGVAALMASLLKAAKKKQKVPQGEASGSGEAAEASEE